MNKLPPLREHQIQTLIKNYLESKGWFVMRLNSGVLPMANRDGGFRRVRLSRAGTPDLMAFKKSLPFSTKFDYPSGTSDLIFIEVKRKGNKPTFAQEQMMLELAEHGARCLVIHSLEEVQAQTGI